MIKSVCVQVHASVRCSAIMTLFLGGRASSVNKM